MKLVLAPRWVAAAEAAEAVVATVVAAAAVEAAVATVVAAAAVAEAVINRLANFC